ncbi:MAG: Ubiquinone biosynthesis O-methyltransferase [Pyrinomonadaceae bacterium]|nr:Ubiquinone biosynthesis O-methyltransferase [Pyrinomonadaceae bacterium]
MGHYGIYDRVEELLRGEKGRVLDVPAGEGALAVRLKKIGLDVTCCDLYPRIFKLEDTEIREGDLDARLPFDDADFDTVVCVEGLEHIENPANAIREFARILKTDGMAIVSVPNIMNIEERLKWLFYGYTSHFKPLSKEAIRVHQRHEMGGMDEIAFHINPIGYAELRYLLEKAGFEIEGAFADSKKNGMWAFAPLVGAISLAANFSSREKRATRWTDEMNSAVVLKGGNTLILVARNYEKAYCLTTVDTFTVAPFKMNGSKRSPFSAFETCGEFKG